MFPEMLSPSDVLVDYTTNLEKKQRNLVKRQAKLDVYRDMLRSGKTLTPDQEKAVSEYESVMQSISSLKEMIDVINELHAKVEHVSIENAKRMAYVRDEYAKGVLRTLCPILDLLSKIQSPIVRDAVIKSSSPQQYKVLETASKAALTIPSDKEGIEEILRSGDLFNHAAEYLLKLAEGTNTPINGKNGKARGPTFAEFKKMCLDLLVREEVRLALTSPYIESTGRKSSNAANEVATDRNPIPEIQPVVDVPVVQVVKESVPVESNTVAPVSQLPSEAILNSVINPLKTNFNFLQASHVAAAPLVHQIPQAPVVQCIPPTQLSSQSIIPPSTVPVQVLASNASHKALNGPKTEAVQTACHDAAVVPVVAVEPKETVVVQQPVQRQQSVNLCDGDKASGDIPSPKESLRDVMNEEKQTQPVQLKQSWADRVRAAPNPPSKPMMQRPTGQKSTQPANGHVERPPSRDQRQQHSREHRPVRNSVNEAEVTTPVGTTRPRGGTRGGGGGRGRGTGGMAPRGNRGRGAPRGNFSNRGDYHHNNAASRRPVAQSS